MEICDKKKCTGCSTCVNVCPIDCIKMETDEGGFGNPIIDDSVCINCGKCVRSCPINNCISKNENNTAVFAAKNKDDSVRTLSTSGGIFSLLCDYIISEGGTVFGAAFDDSFVVRHIGINNVSDINRLRTAKYSQSDIGNTFKEAKQLLDNGKWVLYSGTPCQIAGIKMFLGEEYERLVLVDLICLGVPSPQVWKDYLEYRKKKDCRDALPKAINMRSKETGWARYSVRFDYDDGTIYSKKNDEDPYMRAFVNGLMMRSSCYQCEFKGISRISDFTLGDYWGVWTYNPELEDSKGVSVVSVHSDKGKTLWKLLSKGINFIEINKNESFIENPAALRSIKDNPKRMDFMGNYKKMDFQDFVTELLPVPLAEKTNSESNGIVSKIKRKIRNRVR